MSEYSGIRGTRVKYLASDPTLNTSTEGQVWYNSTSGTLKSLVQIKATSSGGNMSTARGTLGGAGTQTAGLGFGGYTWTPPAVKNSTEEYNGFNWSNGGNMGTARVFPKGCGTQTAALAFGGDTTNLNNETGATEEYDGSAWTASGSLNTSRYNIAPAGIQTAAIGAGGYKSPASPKFTTNAESYDGTSWTAITAMPEGKAWAAGAGTQTSALISGGLTPAVSANSLLWNGSAWTAGGTMNTARGGIAGAGLSTAAIVYGNSTSNVIEEYDGSVWATSPATMANSLFGRNSATNGTISAGLMFSGTNPPSTASAATEEYNSNINVITQAVWSSGGTLATSRNRIGGAGTQTAGLAFGGAVSPGGGEPTVSTATEEYNGSSWTSGGALGTARYGVKGCGIQTAGLAVGGVINPNSAPGATRDTEEYNGSSWTASSDTNNNFYLDGVAGTQTAAVSRSGAGGPPGPAGNYTEEYNGATWTTVPATIGTARYTGSFIGTQTAAIYCGGQPSTPVGFLSDTYDGTSFSSAPSMVLQFARGGGAGTQTDAIVFAPSTASVNAQQYDGISWVTSANMATERNSVADSPAATASAALAAGGGPGVKNNTEEFTGGTEVVTASTLTTS